ncbi:hypothetical protein ACFC90_08125 [Enterococcus casseliflavus]|uniref:Uncharacterized protein n=1 Tax=Enterococcus casseliflavus TaxID=37734 RepID=A0A6N3CGR0_ENTCA
MMKKGQMTPEAYLNNYSELCYLQEFPLIKQVCTELQTRFKEICYTEYDNVLQQMADLLEIDAQLQMFLEFFRHDFFKEIELAEEEIVKMIKKDKNVYYRQMAGIGTNQKAPHGLIYLSEK